MNISWSKVRGCLTSCFAILAVCSFVIAVPVSAAVYDISDYFDYNEVDNSTNIRTAYYTVNVEPYTRVTRGDGSFVIDGYGSFDWVFPDTENSNYRAVVSVYPFGGLLYTNSAAHDFVLDVSDIMDGTIVTISADIAVRFDEMTGSQIPTLDISYRSFIVAYDANMKFVANTLTEWKSASLVSEGVAEVENSVSYTLPRNTFYIGIVSQFRIDSTYEIGTMHWGVAPRPVVLSVPVDMIYQQSQTMDKINNQLGNIISGTPDQNENANNSAGTVEDQKNQIGNLVDQMAPSRPNTDHIDTDINAIAGVEATLLFSNGIGDILNHPLILSMLSIVAVVSFVGYVLFGKVG